MKDKFALWAENGKILASIGFLLCAVGVIDRFGIKRFIILSQRRSLRPHSRKANKRGKYRYLPFCLSMAARQSIKIGKKRDTIN